MCRMPGCSFHRAASAERSASERGGQIGVAVMWVPPASGVICYEICQQTGDTEFRFWAGDLDFHSSSYEFLVITMGGTNAQFKGSGTINGGLAPSATTRPLSAAINGHGMTPARPPRYLDLDRAKRARGTRDRDLRERDLRPPKFEPVGRGTKVAR